MKKAILLLMSVCMAIVAQAQVLPTLSVEVGMGISGHTSTDNTAGSPRFSQKIGMYVDVPMNEFLSFQTGLALANKGAVNMYDSKFKTSQMYIELPLLAALHVGTEVGVDIVLNAGPYFAYGVYGRYHAPKDNGELNGNVFHNAPEAGFPGYRRYDGGVQVGVKADVAHWNVGATFECGLVPIAAGQASNNYGLYLTAGYKF